MVSCRSSFIDKHSSLSTMWMEELSCYKIATLYNYRNNVVQSLFRMRSAGTRCDSFHPNSMPFKFLVMVNNLRICSTSLQPYFDIFQS